MIDNVANFKQLVVLSPPYRRAFHPHWRRLAAIIEQAAPRAYVHPWDLKLGQYF